MITSVKKSEAKFSISLNPTLPLIWLRQALMNSDGVLRPFCDFFTANCWLIWFVLFLWMTILINHILTMLLFDVRKYISVTFVHKYLETVWLFAWLCDLFIYVVRRSYAFCHLLSGARKFLIRLSLSVFCGLFLCSVLPFRPHKKVRKKRKKFYGVRCYRIVKYAWCADKNCVTWKKNSPQKVTDVLLI